MGSIPTFGIQERLSSDELIDFTSRLAVSRDVPALTVGQWPYELEVAIEEGFELLGVALIAAALFATLVDDLVHVRTS